MRALRRSLGAVPKRTRFEEIAADLYSRRPDEFTAARNARVRDARSTGDAALAEAIRSLRKPTASAWLANMLAGEGSPEMARLFQLGDALRKAQASLDADALRLLSQERHGAVQELTSRAQRLARDRGEVNVGASALRELESTLEAALFDPGAAAELRRGRLTGALTYSGLGFATPGGGAVPVSPASSRTRAATRRTPGHPPQGRASTTRGTALAAKAEDQTAHKRAVRELEDARGAAKRAADALSVAERAAARARTSLVGAEAEVGRRRAAVRQAEQGVRQARAERDRRAQDVRRAERRLESPDDRRA